MWGMLYGEVSDTGSVPVDQEAVRSTTQAVDPDRPAAMMDAPEWNEFQTDPDPALGLGPRSLASEWHGREKFVPQNLDEPSAVAEGFARQSVDQSSKGTAAARERAGQTGPGTVPYAVGIEPYIRDGGAFGNDYFARQERSPQEGTGAGEGQGVAAYAPDRSELVGVMTYGRQNAQDAAASAYQSLIGH